MSAATTPGTGIVAGIHGQLASIDARHGHIRWISEAPFKVTANPVVASSNVLLIGTGGELKAFDVATGRETGAVDVARSGLRDPLCARCYRCGGWSRKGLGGGPQHLGYRAALATKRIAHLDSRLDRITAHFGRQHQRHRAVYGCSAWRTAKTSP